ncbi:MAG: hypothetical protein AB7S75_08985 [Desulfococcaceae bacterium]
MKEKTVKKNLSMCQVCCGTAKPLFPQHIAFKIIILEQAGLRNETQHFEFVGFSSSTQPAGNPKNIFLGDFH